MSTEILQGREWLVQDGAFGVLQKPTQGVPGLRKPYEFELPADQVFKLVKQFRQIKNADLCQILTTFDKPTKYGTRFEVFALAYAPGLVTGPGEKRGVTREQWMTLVNEMNDVLFKYLGATAKPYAEAWNEERKFQYRFETYIKYKEVG